MKYNRTLESLEQERKQVDFEAIVRRRRVVRHFLSDPIPGESLDRILRLSQRAPSAGNSQGQTLVVVTKPDRRKQVGEICGEREDDDSRYVHHWVSEAPALVIPCTSEEVYRQRYSEADKILPDGSVIEWPIPYWHIDIGATIMLVLLSVVNEGMAAGFTGTQRTDDLKALLNIPEYVTPVGVIPIGYPDDDIPSPSLKRGRRPFEDFVRFESWVR